MLYHIPPVRSKWRNSDYMREQKYIPSRGIPSFQMLAGRRPCILGSEQGHRGWSEGRPLWPSSTGTPRSPPNSACCRPAPARAEHLTSMGKSLWCCRETSGEPHWCSTGKLHKTGANATTNQGGWDCVCNTVFRQAKMYYLVHLKVISVFKTQGRRNPESRTLRAFAENTTPTNNVVAGGGGSTGKIGHGKLEWLWIKVKK